MTSATMAATFSATVALPTLLWWRCRNVRCRRFICRLEWNGRTVAEYKCCCETWTRLPEHADVSLRDDGRKW